MQDYKANFRQNWINLPWARGALRLLMVLALVAVMGLAGNSISEFRLYQAIAAVPAAQSEPVLDLDCASAPARASVEPAPDQPGRFAASPASLMLQGFRCTIPLTPD